MSTEFRSLFEPDTGGLILRIDGGGAIIGAEGETQRLLGLERDELIGVPFVDRVSRPDRAMVTQLLHAVGAEGRANRQVIAMDAMLGTLALFVVDFGPVDGAGGFTLELQSLSPAEHSAWETPDGATLNPFPDHEEFIDNVGARLRDDGEDYDLTLLEMGGPTEERLRELVGSDAVDWFRESTEGVLRAYSVDGQAARISDNNYGILHERDAAAADAITQRIDTLAQECGIAEQGFGVGAATLELESDTLMPEQIGEALDHMLDTFVERGAAGFVFETLSSAHESVLAEAERKLSLLRNALSAGELSLRFRPIVDLDAGAPCMLEALALVEADGLFLEPARLVDLTAERHLRAEIDLALYRQALHFITEADTRGEWYRLAVPVSAHSLVAPRFMEGMYTLWQGYSAVAPRITIMLADFSDLSAAPRFKEAYRQFQEYKRPVCIEDFGAALISLEEIKALDVNFVRLDARYTAALASAGEDNTLIADLLGQWSRIGVKGIADGITDAGMLPGLKARGIVHGAGPHLGTWHDDANAFGPLTDPGKIPETQPA